MGKYLDYNGLSYLWDKIKLYLFSALSTKVDKISSTDNAAARFNGEQGAILNSGVIIDDNNNVTAAKFITSGGTASQVVLGTGALQAANTLPQYEAYLEWGGKNFQGSYGPIDAAMVSDLGANRLLFLKAGGITIEYSTDGGSTWIDYGLNDSLKVALFSTSATVVCGKHSSGTAINSNYQARVTISSSQAGIYTTLNKFVISVGTNGSSGCWCTITGRTQTNFANNVDTWATFANKVGLQGWSGYNVINTSGITAYGNPDSASTQYRQVRFTFGYTGGSTTTYSGLTIYNIQGFGGVGWATPSTMAKTGHLYSFDSDLNATFPANITAAKIIKSNGTSSQFLKADGSVDSNTYLKTGDIAAWAKEANKPSYSWSEITNKPDTFTPSSHTHGNISNTGTLTDTAAASGTNDLIVLRNSSDNKVRTSTIKGTDVEDAVSKKHAHSNITLSKTAQAYDGTHTIVLPSSDPYTSARTPSSHTHGNIQNGGTLQTNDITIANGDKLVVTDSSDSSKVARTSVSFDGSTTTKALTPKGTWVTFLQTETDPTVPAWAKASSKPTYNLDEVSDGSTRKLSTLAPKASPALTGTPTAPTASTGTNTTLIATTAFVLQELSGITTDIEDNEKVIAAALTDLEDRKLNTSDLNLTLFNTSGSSVCLKTEDGTNVTNIVGTDTYEVNSNPNIYITGTQFWSHGVGNYCLLTADVIKNIYNELDTDKADLYSPVFTGSPTAPTATTKTNNNQLATTAFVQQEINRGSRIIPLLENGSTTAGTWLAKTNEITSLVDGQLFYYKIAVAGASTTTLNITNSAGTALGAKTIYRTGTGKLTTHYSTGTYLLLQYNTLNDCFRLFNEYDSNSTTVYGYYDLYFRPYAAEDIYRYKLVALDNDGRLHPITLTNQTSTTQVAKTPTSAGLKPYKLWYYYTTTATSAGAVTPALVLASATHAVSPAYTFNTSIPAYKLTYLKGTYNSHLDLFYLYIDNSSPCTSFYVNAPINTGNVNLSEYFTEGYYYWLVGGSYSSADYFALFDENPLYYFNGTSLVPAEIGVNNKWYGTEDEFDALTNLDDNTDYYIYDE